jgi:hypothetical protein
LLSINYTGGAKLLAGSTAVAIACFDVWWKGANAGFSNSLDEILLLTGVALIAGVRNLFAAKSPPTKNGFTLPLSFLVVWAGRCSTEKRDELWQRYREGKED